MSATAMGGKRTLAHLRFGHMRYVITAATALALSVPAHAQSTLERGFAGALRGCEEWVLNPASWTEGTGPFVKAVGLGEQMGLVETVEEVNLPPEQLRRANHYWRINSTPGAGYILGDRTFIVRVQRSLGTTQERSERGHGLHRLPQSAGTCAYDDHQPSKTGGPEIG